MGDVAQNLNWASLIACPGSRRSCVAPRRARAPDLRWACRRRDLAAEFDRSNQHAHITFVLQGCPGIESSRGLGRRRQVDERLKHIEPALLEKIQNEILDR